MDEHVSIFLKTDRDGVHFSDNYFGFYIRPQMEEYVQNSLETQFSDVKVFYTPGNQKIDDYLTRESTLEDYLGAETEYSHTFFVFIKHDQDMTEQEYEDMIDRAAGQLDVGNDRWTLMIYAVSDDVYDLMDRKTRSDFVEDFIKGGSKPDGDTCFFKSNLILS